MSESLKRYQNDGEIDAVVRGFEECATTPSQFDHLAHVTVAFAYLQFLRLTVPEAAGRMRKGLYHFLDHYGPDRQKYNETITLFWIKLVRGFLDRCDTSRPLADLANEVVDACGNSQLIHNYYSKERLASKEAQGGWVEPDLKALDY